MRVNLTKKEIINSIYMQLGFSKKITVPSNLDRSSKILFLPFFGGRKPSKINLSVGRPEGINAANTEDAPGTLCILMFSLIACLTSL